MKEGKQDMSKVCAFKCDEYRYKAHVTHEISEEAWVNWYQNYCGKCQYMCEVCMYGEG